MHAHPLSPKTFIPSSFSFLPYWLGFQMLLSLVVAIIINLLFGLSCGFSTKTRSGFGLFLWINSLCSCPRQLRVDCYVKSAYYIQKEWEDMQLAECSSQKRTSKIWKTIWKLQLPPVEKMWFWKASHDILPTRDALFRRKVISDPSCPICGLEAETGFHILWRCSSAQDVWSGGSVIFQKSVFDGPAFLQVAEGMLEKCDREEVQKFVVTARRIWLRRNAFLHEGVFSHPDTIIRQANATIQEFQQAMLGDHYPGQLETLTGLGQQWPLPTDWFLVTWDAALGTRTGTVGYRALIRNHHGDLLAAQSLTRVGLLEPDAAEALGALMAIQLARQMGCLKIHLQGDAKVIVEAVNSSAQDWSRRGHLTDDLRLTLAFFTQWKMEYIPRDTNQGAHVLARMATKQSMERVWFSDYLECIRDLCEPEHIARSML